MGVPGTAADRAAAAARRLRLAAAVLTVTAVVCVALGWSEDTHRAGFSWYGTQWPAALPYTVGMVITAVLLHRAAAALDAVPDLAWARFLLHVSAAATVGLSATPITVARSVHMVHNVFGAVLFLSQLLFVLVAMRLLRTTRSVVLASAQLVAGIAALLSWLDVVEVMLWAQATFQSAFLLQAPTAVTTLVGGTSSHDARSRAGRGLPTGE